MGRCGCGGSNCSCLITNGQGITVTGTGNETDPYVVAIGSPLVQRTVTTPQAIDLASLVGDVVLVLELSGNITAIALPTAAGTRIDVVILRDSLTRTIAWPINILWPGNVEPVLSAVGARDWIVLRNIGGGFWVGAVEGANLI